MLELTFGVSLFAKGNCMKQILGEQEELGMKIMKRLIICLLALVMMIPVLPTKEAKAAALNWVSLAPTIGDPVPTTPETSPATFLVGFSASQASGVPASGQKTISVKTSGGVTLWSEVVSYYTSGPNPLLTSLSPDGNTAYIATAIYDPSNVDYYWKVWQVTKTGTSTVTVTSVLRGQIYIDRDYDHYYELVAMNGGFVTSFRQWDDEGEDYEWRDRVVWVNGTKVASNSGDNSSSDTGQLWNLDGYVGFALNGVAKIYNKSTGAEVWSGISAMFPSWWETDDGEDRDYDYLKYDPVNNKIYYFYYEDDDFSGPKSYLNVKNISSNTTETVYSCDDCAGYGHRYNDDTITMDIQDVMDTAHDFYFYDTKTNVFSFVDRPPGLLIQYNAPGKYHYVTSGGINYLVTFSEIPTSEKVIDIVTENALKGTNLIYNGDFEQGTSGFEKVWGTEPHSWAVTTTPNAISGSHLLDATGDVLIRSTKYIPYSRTKQYRLSITTAQANPNNMAVLGIFLYDDNFANERWLSLKGYNSTTGINKIEVDLPQYTTYGGYSVRYIRPGLALNYANGVSNLDYSWADDFTLEDITTLSTKADQTVVTALSSEVSVTKSIASNALTEAQTTNETLNTIISPQLDVVESQTWDSTESKSAATLSKEARDKANEAVTAISNVQTSITNISNFFPPIFTKASGYNKASITTTTTFKVTLEYSGATEYRMKLDNGTWSSWGSLNSHDRNGYLTVSGINTAGMHTVYVEIRNGATGPVSKGKCIFFKK